MHPRLLLVALRLLTRLPVGEPSRAEPDAARSVAWFGVAGTLIGGVAASTWWLATLALPRSAAAVAALAVTILLTGAVHEDGLADTAEGLACGRDPDSRLRIMRDATLGTYGVLALLVAVLLRVTLLAGLAPVQGAAALVVVAALGRSAAGVASIGTVPAEAEGRGAALLDHLSPGPPAMGALVALGVGVALLGPSGIAVAAVALGAAVLVRAMAVRRLGGLTGDVLGAMAITAEVAALGIVAALDAGAALPGLPGL